MALQIDYLKNHPQHLSLLAEWYFGMRQQYNLNKRVEDYKKKLKTHLNSHFLPITYIALKEKQPVGMISLCKTVSLKSPLMPWITALFVQPAHRNQGIATQLLETSLDRLRILGYKNAYLLTVRGSSIKGWYESLGWELIDTGITTHTQTLVNIFGINL